MSSKSQRRAGKAAKKVATKGVAGGPAKKVTTKGVATITPVSGIDDIPDGATPDRAFRLEADVLEVAVRASDTGEPSYLLSLRDDSGAWFSAVGTVGDWWRLNGTVSEGVKVKLDVRVPEVGYSMYRLVTW